jgi:cysteine-rich repeat protein
MSNQHLRGILIATLGLTACANTTETSELGQEAQLSGAIFTTTATGSRVNANIYSAKEDVYLDGGPGNNAPAGAAGLPAGSYYFQVTNPNGHVLLSTDSINCRRFLVSGDGVITRPEGPCPHMTGIDMDHPELGAVTIQLFPYNDTPNPGGEYKVWITPIDKYDPTHTRTNGFIERYSKTDNFKVRVPEVPPPPQPYCGDGVVNQDSEQCDDGALNGTAGDSCSADCKIIPPPPPPCCGDGHVDPGEQCDDGALNGTAGDSCSATCTLIPPGPVCGNGIVEAGETCDDGALNGTAGDSCSATCQCVTPAP